MTMRWTHRCAVSSILFLFSLTLLQAQEQVIMDFQHSVDSPAWIRRGFPASNRRNIFPHRPFLPRFHTARLDLHVTATPSPHYLALTVLDGEDNVFRLPMEYKGTKENIATYSVMADATVPWPPINRKEAGEKIIPQQPLRLFSLECASKETIHLRTLTFREMDLAFSLDTGKQIKVWDLTSPSAPILTVSNGGQEAPTSVDFALCDDRGNSLQQGSRTALLKNGDRLDITLERPLRQAIYHVSATCRKGGKTYVYRSQFAAMKPVKAKPSGSFILGICEHFQRYSSQDVLTMMEYLDLCGAQEARISWLWPTINPAQGVWDFSRTDWIVDQLARRDIRPLALLGAAPRYAWATGYRKKTEASQKKGLRLPVLSLYENWVRQFAQHYQGKISKFCVWNEPDVVGFADFDEHEYLKLQQAAHRALKSVSPHNQVIVGGFSDMLRPFSQQVLQLMAREAPHSADLISAHLYSHLNQTDDVLRQGNSLLKRLNLKQRLVSEETGAGTTDDHLQQKTMFQKVIQARMAGFGLFYWYNLRNCGPDPRNREDNFGLLNYDLTPRASYLTFAMISSLYSNATPRETLPWQHLYAARFETNQECMYATWLEKRTQNSTLAVFQTDARSLQLIDLQGNRRDLSIREGRVMLPLDSDGQTLLLKPQTARLTYLGEALTSTSPLFIHPGGRKRLTFDARLLPQGTTVRLQPVKGLSAEPATRDASGKLILTLQATADFPARTVKHLTLQVIGHGQPQGDSVSFVTQQRYEIKPDSMTKVGYLGTQAQARNLLPNVPQYGTMFWTGPQDAAVAFGATMHPRTLHFQIGTYDDVHVQNFTPERLWQGDSVQLIIQFPGQNTHWELGFAMNEQGQFLKHIWHAPQGMDIPKALKGIRLTGQRCDRETTGQAQAVHHNIHLVLILENFGVSPDAVRQQGALFNLLFNDNDGERRESQLSFMGAHATHPQDRLPQDAPLLMVAP